MNSKTHKQIINSVILMVVLLLSHTPSDAQINNAQSVDDKAAQADTLLRDAQGLYQKGLVGLLPTAITKLDTARKLYEKLGNKTYEATCYFLMGSINNTLNEKQKSLEQYNQALVLFKLVSDKLGEATTLNNTGGVYENLGEKRKALECFTQALALYRVIGDKRGEAMSFHGIADIQFSLGDNQKALEILNQTLPLWKLLGDKSGEVATLNGLGSVYDRLGDNQKALEHYNQALSLGKPVGDKVSEAGILNNIGGIHSKLSEHQKALEYYNQAMTLWTLTGDKRGVATAYGSIGFTYENLGEKQKAFQNYLQALIFYTVVSDKEGEAITLTNVSSLMNQMGNHRFAVAFSKLSINRFQELRSNLKGLDKSAQQTYLKLIEKTYRHLADILITNNRLGEAQQALNLFKDQQAFDSDQQQSMHFAQLDLTVREGKFVNDYNQNLTLIGSFNQRVADLLNIVENEPTTTEIAKLKRFEADLQQAIMNFMMFLSRADEEFAASPNEQDKEPQPADFVNMQTALRETSAATKQNTVAVYTLVGKENFHALIITPDTKPNSIKSASFPIKSDVLNEKAKRFWALLQSDKYDTTKLGKELYDTVFKPLEKELPKDTQTILWSLDGNLRYVPMAALYDGEKKQYLVERYQNVVFTRADVERMTRKVSGTWTGMGFGSSQRATVEVLGSKISFSALDGVTKELSEIFKEGDKGILAGETYRDEKFSKPNFIKAMKQKRPLVHIASHFSFRPGDEARSFLLMGDGSAFTLADMKKETNMFAGVDLLTLSACNTAAQQSDANGREIDGFAELAQRLGAGAVMATLWQVSDASTPWLMRDFYANRETNTGMTKTQSLQKAQLALLNGTAETKPLPNLTKGDSSNDVEIVIVPKNDKEKKNKTRSDQIYLEESDAMPYKKKKDKPFAHPFYWSPFVLYGNWK